MPMIDALNFLTYTIKYISAAMVTINPVLYEIGFEKENPSGANIIYEVTTEVINSAGSSVI